MSQEELCTAHKYQGDDPYSSREKAERDVPKLFDDIHYIDIPRTTYEEDSMTTFQKRRRRYYVTPRAEEGKYDDVNKSKLGSAPRYITDGYFDNVPRITAEEKCHINNFTYANEDKVQSIVQNISDEMEDGSKTPDEGKDHINIPQTSEEEPPVDTKSVARRALYTCRQQPGQTFMSFVQEIEQRMTECGMVGDPCLLKQLLMFGVRDRALKDRMLGEHCLNLLEVIECGLESEDYVVLKMEDLELRRAVMVALVLQEYVILC